MDKWDKFLELLKGIRAPVLVATVVMSTGLLLFAQELLPSQLSIATLVDDHRQWLGLTFLVSSVLALVLMTAAVATRIKTGWVRWRSRRRAAGKLLAEKHRLLNVLLELTPQEKPLIRRYFQLGSAGVRLEAWEDQPIDLVRLGVLHLPDPFSQRYGLAGEARDILRAMPELLND